MIKKQYKSTLEEIIVESRINSINVILIKQAVFYDPVIQKKLEDKIIILGVPKKQQKIIKEIIFKKVKERLGEKKWKT